MLKVFIVDLGFLPLLSYVMGACENRHVVVEHVLGGVHDFPVALEVVLLLHAHGRSALELVFRTLLPAFD